MKWLLVTLVVLASCVATWLVQGQRSQAEPTVRIPCGSQLTTHAEDDACTTYQRASDGVIVHGPWSSKVPADQISSP